MSLLSLLARLALFGIVTVSPFALLGLAVGHTLGFACAWLLLALFLVTGCAVYAESGICRLYRARRDVPDSLRRSLDRVLASLGGGAPRVVSFCDPAPQALVVRGLGRRGTILLSEGLLGALTEDELRTVLSVGVSRLRSRGICFQSLCAWLAHLTLELAPESWLQLIFGEVRWHPNLGALGAVRFLILFSVAKFYVGVGRVSWDNAPRCFARLPAASGEVSNPGSCILHFSDPWGARALIGL